MSGDDPASDPSKLGAEFSALFESIVQNPDFPGHLSLIKLRCHGGPGQERGCYWCFQIATGSDLPYRHRLLEPEMDGDRVRANANQDPLTSDGRAHAWEPIDDRILCEDCIVDLPAAASSPSAPRGTGLGYRNYLRRVPIHDRSVVSDLGRPDLTPEEFLALEQLPVGERTLDNIGAMGRMFVPMAAKLAEVRAQAEPEKGHTVDGTLDDPAFTTTFLAAFQRGKETYGERFALVAMLTRAPGGRIAVEFFPFQAGATSDVIVKTMRGRYGPRLLGVVACQMAPK